ncbi:MAG: DUF6538 domain-containing protein, partial [Roseicyclus sp.]
MVPRRGRPAPRQLSSDRAETSRFHGGNRNRRRRLGFRQPRRCGAKCGADQVPSSAASYLERRGKTYYIRMRVPSEFADVEPLAEINRSLKTGDRTEAEARCANARAALHAEWRARRAGEAADTRAVFGASMEPLKGWGMSFSPTHDLLVGPIDELLSRIEAVANVDATSAFVPAALGAVDLPDASLEEMAER